MPNQAQFDLAAYAGVKPSLDASLGEVSASLELYLASPTQNAAALDVARSELRRLSGALKMVHLDGVVIFCAELENVLNELSANPALISALHKDVLRRTLLGMTHYLDSLSRGADNVVLRLFPHYQELQQLRGLEMAFETDLFFPNLVVQLPENVLSIVQQSDGSGRIKAGAQSLSTGI